jgi:glucose/arabinose dehydrogenase
MADVGSRRWRRGLPGAVLALGVAALSAPGCYGMRGTSGSAEAASRPARVTNAADVAVPPGYRIEAVATGLTFPTGIAFDDEARLYVVEAGYSFGAHWAPPQLLRLEPDGRRTTVATGRANGPWNGVAFRDGAFFVAEGGEQEGGRILRITGGSVTPLVEDLPSLGDHHTTGPAVGPDGWIYFGQGTATNSGVVGEDSASRGWLARHPSFHDTPCRDVALRGVNFPSKDLLGDARGEVATGAYLPFGTPSRPGQVVRGSMPCSGAVMRVRPRGGKPELVAWGFRNPFGLAFSPEGQLYVTDNGYDERGSRPVGRTPDFLWKVTRGQWYGWPDFAGGEAVDAGEQDAPGQPRPARLLASFPNAPPPRPAALFAAHSSTYGTDFSRSEAFGHVGDAFTAQFGDLAPAAAEPARRAGFKVVRVEPQTGVIEEFAANDAEENGPASRLRSGGLVRPNGVRFSPDGSALYIVDFGVMTLGPRRPEPQEETGVLWRVTREW